MVISLISPSVQNSTRTSISGASVGASAACVSGVRRLCAAKTALIKMCIRDSICIVDDPEKKTIPVKLVRDACTDLYIRPNEGQRKIYLFPRAQDLNQQGQNVLLKSIEEPPPYGTFLLLAEHAEQLLPTIRSRCVELRQMCI